MITLWNGHFPALLANYQSPSQGVGDAELRCKSSCWTDNQFASNIKYHDTDNVIVTLLLWSDKVMSELSAWVHAGTLRYHYDTAQYTIMTVQWLQQNTDQSQSFNAQKRPICHPNGPAMGCLLWEFLEKIGHIVMTLRCIFLFPPPAPFDKLPAVTMLASTHTSNHTWPFIIEPCLIAYLNTAGAGRVSVKFTCGEV